MVPHHQCGSLSNAGLRADPPWTACLEGGENVGWGLLWLGGPRGGHEAGRLFFTAMVGRDWRDRNQRPKRGWRRLEAHPASHWWCAHAIPVAPM